MSDVSPAPNGIPSSKHLEFNWSLILSGVTAYSVGTGIAYLWGYWAPFGVNILDYMGLSDILTATAWPLLGVVGTMLAGALLSVQQPSIAGSSEKNRVGEIAFWYWSNLRPLHFLGLFWIWALDTPHKWALLAVLGGMPLAIYIAVQKWMAHVPLSSAPKFFVIYIIVLAPPMSIYKGQQDSAALVSGEVYRAVYSELNGVSMPSDVNDDRRLRLIGQRGDTLFLWEPQLKRTVVSKFPSESPLIVGQVKKAPEASFMKTWLSSAKNWINW